MEYVYVIRYRLANDRTPWVILSVCKTEELARETVKKHKQTDGKLYHSIKEYLLAHDLETASAGAARGYDVIWENGDGVYESQIHKNRKARREVGELNGKQ